MSVVDFLSIAGVVVGVLAPVFGFLAYIWKNLVDRQFAEIKAAAKEDVERLTRQAEKDAERCKRDFDNLERLHTDLRLHVAENYVRHTNLEEIKKTLQLIFDKLDAKEDRAPRRRAGE